MIYSARPKPRSLFGKIMSLRAPQFTKFASEPSGESLLMSDASANRTTDVTIDGTIEIGPESLTDQFDLELANTIISRIQSRLPGRVRHLTVFTTDNAVLLTGECSTFYTKQLAQHAAMGVLEYEQLINNIEVRTAK